MRNGYEALVNSDIEDGNVSFQTKDSQYKKYLKVLGIFIAATFVASPSSVQSLFGAAGLSLGKFNSIDELTEKFKSLSARDRTAGWRAFACSQVMNTGLNYTSLPYSFPILVRTLGVIAGRIFVYLPLTMATWCSGDDGARVRRQMIVDRKLRQWVTPDDERKHSLDKINAVSFGMAISPAITLGQMALETFSFIAKLAVLPFLGSSVAYYAIRYVGIEALLRSFFDEDYQAKEKLLDLLHTMDEKDFDEKALSLLKDREIDAETIAEFLDAHNGEYRYLGSWRLVYVLSMMIAVFLSFPMFPMFAKELLGGLTSMFRSDSFVKNNYQSGWLALGYVFSGLPSVALYYKFTFNLCYRAIPYILMTSYSQLTKIRLTKQYGVEGETEEPLWKENTGYLLRGAILAVGVSAVLSFAAFYSGYGMYAVVKTDSADGAFDYLGHHGDWKVFLAEVMAISGLGGAAAVNLNPCLKMLNLWIKKLSGEHNTFYARIQEELNRPDRVVGLGQKMRARAASIDAGTPSPSPESSQEPSPSSSSDFRRISSRQSLFSPVRVRIVSRSGSRSVPSSPARPAEIPEIPSSDGRQPRECYTGITFAAPDGVGALLASMPDQDGNSDESSPLTMPTAQQQNYGTSGSRSAPVPNTR